MNIAKNFYYDWSLIMRIGNNHEPQWVEDVLERVRELSVPNKVFPDSALTLVTGFMIVVAREEATTN